VKFTGRRVQRPRPLNGMALRCATVLVLRCHTKCSTGTVQDGASHGDADSPQGHELSNTCPSPMRVKPCF